MKAPLKGHAYWMIASVSMQQNRYSDADKSIRAALPYLRGDSRLLSTALFYLGWANYKMENFNEAVRFYKQCMAFRGQFQEQAAKNLNVIRTEQGIQ